jgi:DNA primase
VSTDAVAEIKARLDILDVIGGYVSLHRSGTQHVGLCPFHAEKTPSFSVSQPRQVFH